MQPKPKHLSSTYAEQFQDASVAKVYRKRPPYPPETTETIAGLCPSENRRVLELGAGTGEIAIPLAGLMERVDAVEPSAAMTEVARLQSGYERVHWYQTSAEQFGYDDEYGLIVCAQCLGWMDWHAVFPKMAACLHSRGSLVIVELTELSDQRWQGDLRSLISRYSTNQDFVPFDLIEGIVERGLFHPTGSRQTTPMPFTQSIDDFIESLHGRNGFSRDRMSVGASTEFDRAVRNLLWSHHQNGYLEGTIQATITWGKPLPPK